jgi:hypothetical protein
VAHTGADYSPTAAQDFTSGKTYTVTASDSTTKNYTVTVQKAALSSIAVTAMPTATTYIIQSSANTGINYNGMVITGTDSVGNSISLVSSYSGGTTVPAGFTAAYNLTSAGSKLVTLTHTASGKQATFSVTVAADGKDITSLKVGDTWGVISGTNITVTLPYNSSQNLTSVTPIVAHTGVGYSPTAAQNFGSSVSYTVTAMPTTTTYIIQSSANTGINYDGMVITGTDSVGNSISLVSSYTGGATVPTGFTASYNLTSAGTKLVTLTHTASGKQATFSVTVNPNAKDITSLKVGDTYGTISGNAITVTLPYNSGVNLASVTPAVAHTGVSYSPTGAQNFFSNKTYTVTAADGSTKDYTVTVQ